MVCFQHNVFQGSRANSKTCWSLQLWQEHPDPEEDMAKAPAFCIKLSYEFSSNNPGQGTPPQFIPQPRNPR